MGNSTYLEVGVYEPAVVVGSVISLTKTGKEALDITFEYEGQRSTWRGFFTEAAWPQTERALKALGWDPSTHNYDMSGLNTGDGSPLVGAQAQIDVREEPYTRADGTAASFTKIRWVNEVGAAAPGLEPMERGAVASLSARLKAREVAKKGTPTPKVTRPGASPAAKPAPRAPARPAPAPEGEPLPEDDIPF